MQLTDIYTEFQLLAKQQHYSPAVRSYACANKHLDQCTNPSCQRRVAMLTNFLDRIILSTKKGK